MFSFKSIVIIAGALAITEASGIAAVAAPLIAPAQVGYAHAVPQNIPPHASQFSYVNRGLSPLIAGPFAAPLAAPVGPSPYFLGGPAPYVAGPAPYVAGPAPYVAGPAPYVAGPAPYAAGLVPYAAGPAPYAAGPAPYAAGPIAAGPIAAPFLGGPAPYTLPGPAPFAGPAPFSPAPLLRSPYGYAPAYVR